MDMEREPQRQENRQQRKPHVRPSDPQARTATHTAQFERVTFAREACYILGALFITIGLVGFVVDNLMGAHLSYTNNVIHVLSGVVALISAYASRRAARICAYSLGAIYGVLGILGFIMGLPADPSVGAIARDSSLWVISPQVLEFGTADHILHLVFAAAFILAASIHRQRSSKTPVWN